MSVVIVGGHDRIVAQYKKIYVNLINANVRFLHRWRQTLVRRLDVRIFWYFLLIPYHIRWLNVH